MNIKDTNIRHRQQLEEVPEQFIDMWSGHLGNIEANVHIIEHKPKYKPIVKH